MESVRRQIPNRLRKHRRLMRYKQKDVARMLGLKSANRLSRWEQGTSMPSLINLFKLSALYRTLPCQLYLDLVYELRTEVATKEAEVITNRNSK